MYGACGPGTCSGGSGPVGAYGVAGPARWDPAGRRAVRASGPRSRGSCARGAGNRRAAGPRAARIARGSVGQAVLRATPP
ncbi:hypothetical protein SHJG_8306 [Streptomyces hygroscopicus subsp. jinggangensis 5008]|nr:hypothetical protein SHJG_8306 [Streptomyces hygroscopicus subsp. jinggangensis 5008]AGF67729.1 hypothetical protein SHJGH_8067 [Streptomyces hygroscopicus subsp. jinggangensis TL01]